MLNAYCILQPDMRSLITSFLVQSKECILPGIGVLQLIHTPASTEAATNRILPPFEGISFKNENHSTSPGLVKYIAEQKNVEKNEAYILLSDFCKEWEERLKTGEKLHFETLGSLHKNSGGVIIFEKEKFENFLQPITVTQAYQKTAPAESIISNGSPSSQVFEAPEQEIVIEHSYWGLWALILVAVGAVMIFYYFKVHGLSNSSLGNQHKYSLDSSKATYTVPEK